MKKYVLVFIFFLGCFFINSNDFVSADYLSTSVVENASDSRNLNVTIDGIFSGPTTKIVIQEVEYCEEVDEAKGCVEISRYLDGSNKALIVKSLGIKEYEITDSDATSMQVNYYITSEGDGEKFFLVDSYNDTNIIQLYSTTFSFNLSTLSQRIIINPDGNGDPSHIYNNVQYSSVRKTEIKINLISDEINLYDGLVYVCEVVKGKNITYSLKSCSDYEVYDNGLEYYIQSYGDGNKSIMIFLEQKGDKADINEVINKNIDTTSIVLQGYKIILKEFYLDTIGPEITIEGDTWVYLESGKKYTPQNATCKDAVFPEDDCLVTNDFSVVSIDYTSDKHQIITYEAADKLGNISTATVKIKVEINEDDNSLLIYFIIAGGVLLFTAAILTYAVLKNNEKKKKMSYI